MVQFSWFVLPVSELNVPAGHGTGTGVPWGQKKPAGHRTSSALLEPQLQWNPAQHLPEEKKQRRKITLSECVISLGAKCSPRTEGQLGNSTNTFFIQSLKDPFYSPALKPCWQKTPGGHKDPVLLSVGFGIVAPIRQRKPAAQCPEGSTKPSDPQNWPAGHSRHSPANTYWQLWPQSKQQNKLSDWRNQSLGLWSTSVLPDLTNNFRLKHSVKPVHLTKYQLKSRSLEKLMSKLDSYFLNGNFLLIRTPECFIKACKILWKRSSTEQKKPNPISVK